MKTLLYLSTLCFTFFLLPGCADKPTEGTHVTMFVINQNGITQEGREVYVFKESKEGGITKKPSNALDVKLTDDNGMVQFNLEEPNLFQSDETAVFSFEVMEIQDGDFVSLASFVQEIKPGDIVNQTLIMQ